IGSNEGYVSFLPYQQNNCGNGGGGGNQQSPQTVFSFNLDGGSLDKLGSAGQSDFNSHVRIAANGSAGVWVYNIPGAQQVFVGPAGTALGGGSGNEVPLGIATIGGDIYVATATNMMTSGGGT